MRIDKIEFSDKLDRDGDIEITIHSFDGKEYLWINKFCAKQIIDHLIITFNLEEYVR